MSGKSVRQTTLKSLVFNPVTLGILLRFGFFFFGLYQDAHMPVKYTDIDYVVFSDAAEYVYESASPYKRETYRYTPLLAWMLVPNSLGDLFYHYGKLLFMFCDILTGILIARLLPTNTNTKTTLGLPISKRTVLLSLWLLNPMVITISTRGSSESVLTFIIMIAVNSLVCGQYTESAIWLGLATHFKIYPIIYLPTFLYYLTRKDKPFTIFKNIPVLNWLNGTNLIYLLVTLLSFATSGVIMFNIYGYEFLYHSYLYHFIRLDHRHNFSVYNVALYYKSAVDYLAIPKESGILGLFNYLTGNLEKVAFVPQIALSAIIIPLSLAQTNLIPCLFIQTLTFVTFNKVITSQYFIWFLIFLPGYLATSKLASGQYKVTGLTMLALWIISQASWLFFAYRLEFVGESTFDNGLFYLSIFFFLTNCWIISQFIQYV